MSLQLQFTVSQSLLLPMSMQVTLPSYFIVDTTLSCNTFVDFVGTCASISSNTIRVNGTFTSSVMGFTVSGFRSSNYVSPTSIYTIVNTFDSNFMKIDESSTDIQFLLKCTMPCRSCSTLLPNVCTSCYSSTTVTSMIYFDALTSQCYAICPTGQWANPTTLLCTACDPNCLTCSTSAVFCLSCYPTSTYPYLSITNITQTCVSSCSIGYYPDKTLSIVTCKACKSPCVTCIN